MMPSIGNSQYLLKQNNPNIFQYLVGLGQPPIQYFQYFRAISSEICLDPEKHMVRCLKMAGNCFKSLQNFPKLPTWLKISIRGHF